MKTTIVGLGLIGGSIAKDLRKAGFASQLTGVENNSDHVVTALSLGLVDTVLPMEEALKDSDLVVITIPVSAIQKVLPGILDTIGAHTSVVDCGSTKALICDAVRNHPKRKQFVAAHPLAGTENSGPTAALEGLFTNKVNIICEKEKSGEQALRVAEKMFDLLGMNTSFMEPNEHDKHVAYVSHLSHVSSFMLGQTVLDIERDEKNIFMLAGSGLASTVRLAKSSPAMWAPIFQQNSENLQKALEEYIKHLQRFHTHLVNNETDKLYEMMNEANQIRRVLEGIELKNQKQKVAIESK